MEDDDEEDVVTGTKACTDATKATTAISDFIIMIIVIVIRVVWFGVVWIGSTVV